MAFAATSFTYAYRLQEKYREQEGYLWETRRENFLLRSSLDDVRGERAYLAGRVDDLETSVDEASRKLKQSAEEWMRLQLTHNELRADRDAKAALLESFAARHEGSLARIRGLERERELSNEELDRVAGERASLAARVERLEREGDRLALERRELAVRSERLAAEVRMLLDPRFGGWVRAAAHGTGDALAAARGLDPAAAARVAAALDAPGAPGTPGKLRAPAEHPDSDGGDTDG